MNDYVVDVKRRTWHKEGKFWFESTVETHAFGNSWEEVQEKLKERDKV